MTTYSVTKDGEEIGYIEAKSFEIEGGALVFHEDEDKLGSLGEMAADTKVRAFNNWDEVERV